MKSLKVRASEANEVGDFQIDEAYCDDKHHCAL